MTQDEINAVKKAAEKMRKQESAQNEIIEIARQAGFKMENSAAIQAAEIFAHLVAAKATARNGVSSVSSCEASNAQRGNIMNKQIEALKLALEALKAAQELAGKHDAELEYGFQQAIAAIKEALAQEQEPDYKLLFDELAEKFALLRDEAEMWKKQALFRFDATATSPQRTKQEPVAYINVEERKLEWAKPMNWNTPTVVKLERIPLYTKEKNFV